MQTNLIFVAGLPRSGTTMMQNILDSHPNIYGGPEFDRIPNIINLYRQLLSSVENKRIDCYTSKEDVTDYIRNLIFSLLTEVKTNKNLIYLSEKTPWNILVFKDLMDIFPEAKFIHILRNPLDVYASMKKVAENAKLKNINAPDFTRDVHIALNYMLTVYNLAQRIEAEGNRNYITFKYEDLVANLENESKVLSNFLGIEWDSKMLDFYKIEHPGEKNMVGAEVWYNKSMFYQEPKKNNSNDKRSIISGNENLLLSSVFADNMYLKSKGYFFEENKKSLLQKIKKYIVRKEYYGNYFNNKMSIRLLN